jgi:hypothetical protein
MSHQGRPIKLPRICRPTDYTEKPGKEEAKRAAWGFSDVMMNAVKPKPAVIYASGSQDYVNCKLLDKECLLDPLTTVMSIPDHHHRVYSAKYYI